MSQYRELGVDADKSAVRKAFKDSVRTDFLGAFVNIIRCQLFPGFVKTQHADGDGSKSLLRLLAYLITGDVTWLYGMVDDGLSMNMGDVACSGFTHGEFTVTDTLNINRFNVPKEDIMRCVGDRLGMLQQLYHEHGIDFDFMGGETADLPRQVHSSVFDITVNAIMPEVGVIKGNIQPGDRIWGFASDGQAKWEDKPNSGIQSNGLTMGGDKLLLGAYGSEYPQVLLAGNEFHGRFRAMDTDPLIEGMVIEALLSPTRQWALVIKCLIDKLNETGTLHLLHGISMNTGGGATKCKALGTGHITFEKKMPRPPGIFQLIQRESGETWKNMFETFNCGIGLDVIGSPELEAALHCVEEQTSVALYDLGGCWASNFENQIALNTPYGMFDY